MDAGLCYDKCKSGYRDGGPMCWQACPAGKTELGPVCSKEIFEGCGGGMIDLGLTCGRRSYGRGVGTIPNKCSSGEEYDAGLCYEKCSSGRVGVGPVCWQNTCPADYPVACGMGCAVSTEACARSIFNQSMSVIEVAQNAVGAGRVLSQARKTAKYVGRAAAREYIRRELEKAAQKHARKLSGEALDELSSYILGEMDDGTGHFDIASLDPTGITQVVMAFNKPICGEGVAHSSEPTLSEITRSAREQLITKNVAQPVTRTPVYVSTANAPGSCLTADKSKKGVELQTCSAAHKLTFSRVEKIKDQRVYQIKHAANKKCLFSNKDGRFAYYKCTAGANDQYWYTARAAKEGTFLLVNANSGKCLFLNKDKRVGVYKCNAKFNDQQWSTRAAPPVPEERPTHLFSANGDATCLDVNASGKIQASACSDDSNFIVRRRGSERGQSTYMIEDLTARSCLRANARGALSSGKCDAKSRDARWYTMPNDAGGVMLASVASGRCLYSNRDGRVGTYACNASYNDQHMILKPTRPAADELEPLGRLPGTEEPVRLGTMNMPKACLSSSGKSSPTLRACDWTVDLLLEQIPEIAMNYTVRLRKRGTGVCLALSADGKATEFVSCKETKNQWWVVSNAANGKFMLENIASQTCLFANKKKVGVYKCNKSYNDQIWFGSR